jgi:hypothetical protein
VFHVPVETCRNKFNLYKHFAAYLACLKNLVPKLGGRESGRVQANGGKEWKKFFAAGWKVGHCVLQWTRQNRNNHHRISNRDFSAITVLIGSKAGTSAHE